MGYTATAVQVGAIEGETAILLDARKASGNAFGNLLQTIDAESIRGKKVRFRAAVRTADRGLDGRAQLWLRADLKGEKNKSRRL